MRSTARCWRRPRRVAASAYAFDHITLPELSRAYVENLGRLFLHETISRCAPATAALGFGTSTDKLRQRGAESTRSASIGQRRRWIASASSSAAS